MTADLSKLMLRAYDAEADNSIRSLRRGNARQEFLFATPAEVREALIEQVGKPA